ncbi:MAG TPA: hypothetical protein VKH81_06410 [Candidatus Angelobacter sp.]|nr:hypothetical protein [Candidatus Angelobacter sp.]
MSLIENFRKAEKKSALSIRRGVERAREEWADAERKLRQRMRIYPQKSKAMAAGAPGTASMDAEESAFDQPGTDAARKPIVSVYGHDLKED